MTQFSPVSVVRGLDEADVRGGLQDVVHAQLEAVGDEQQHPDCHGWYQLTLAIFRGDFQIDQFLSYQIFRNTSTSFSKKPVYSIRRD